MSPRSLTILALSVCFLLTVANTTPTSIHTRGNRLNSSRRKFDNAFSIGFLVWTRAGSVVYTLPREWSSRTTLPRQGRFDVRALPECCGILLMMVSEYCPIGMECCPGLKKVLSKSGQKKVHICHPERRDGVTLSTKMEWAEVKNNKNDKARCKPGVIILDIHFSERSEAYLRPTRQDGGVYPDFKNIRQEEQ